MAKYWAAEPHLDGTTLYGVGDEREADETEVKHLVDLGVLSTSKVEKPGLVAVTEGLKAEGAADSDKSEGKAPANKAA